MTTARTKAATTSASFGTRILTQCIPGLVSGGCAESNRDARECGLKIRGLRSTLELEAGKFYQGRERLADQSTLPTLGSESAFCISARPPYNARRQHGSCVPQSVPSCLPGARGQRPAAGGAFCLCVRQSNQASAAPFSCEVCRYRRRNHISNSSPRRRGPEILVNKNAASGSSRYIYQAPIGYVRQPKQDKRNQHFVSTEVQRGSLGISAVFLPCEVLREYFYRLPLTSDKVDHPTLYEVMRIPASASPSELRVAFKLRDLELRTAGVRHSERVALERAFNIVGQPELRACYDSLLADPDAPAI